MLIIYYFYLFVCLCLDTYVRLEQIKLLESRTKDLLRGSINWKLILNCLDLQKRFISIHYSCHIIILQFLQEFHQICCILAAILNIGDINIEESTTSFFHMEEVSMIANSILLDDGIII